MTDEHIRLARMLQVPGEPLSATVARLREERERLLRQVEVRRLEEENEQLRRYLRALRV